VHATLATNVAGNTMTAPELDSLEKILVRLRALSTSLENDGGWVDQQLHLLAEADVLGWLIPSAYGGSGIDQVTLGAGYERLASACLTTAFVVTQRNAAIQRIVQSSNTALQQELLPVLCSDACFATVGISHLSTSRQHLQQPAVRAQLSGDQITLDGDVPWVTGARFADILVTGGTCDDGRQILVAVDTAVAGLELVDPVDMLALNASYTGSVRLTGVTLDSSRLLAGPVEHVMKHGSGGTGSITTSALALGHVAHALDGIKAEAQQRPELEEIHTALDVERLELTECVSRSALGIGADNQPPPSAEQVRQGANSLVMRATQAYLAACKGAGFCSGHPAERLLREAVFFLVWSCPQPVIQAALREFACLDSESGF